MNTREEMAPPNLEYTMPAIAETSSRDPVVKDILNKFDCIKLSLKYLSLIDLENAGVTARVAEKVRKTEYWDVSYCRISHALKNAKKLSLDIGREGGVEVKNVNGYLTIEKQVINVLGKLLFEKYRQDKSLTELRQYSRKALDASFNM